LLRGFLLATCEFRVCGRVLALEPGHRGVALQLGGRIVARGAHAVLFHFADEPLGVADLRALRHLRGFRARHHAAARNYYGARSVLVRQPVVGDLLLLRAP
jgi:hypothetical protein